MRTLPLLLLALTLAPAWAEHPRLVYTASELSDLKKDPAHVQAARRAAERYLFKTRTEAWSDYGTPLPQTVMPPRHAGSNWPFWTALGAELRMDLEATAFGYVMTGDRRMLERARTMLASIARWDRWTDPDSCSNGNQPCLDTYFLTAGMAIAYDYLYQDLSAAERAVIRRAILDKGVRFIDSRAVVPGSFVNTPATWPNGAAMVIAAWGLGALAVWDEDPDTPALVNRAIEKSRLFLRDFANPDGGLVEGYYYGAASMDPLTLFFTALKRTTGRDLLTHPYFRHAHEWPLYFMIPGTGWLAGFGDSGGPRGTQPLLHGTLSLLARQGLTDIRANWYLQRAAAAKVVEPDYLETVQRWVFYALHANTPFVSSLRATPPDGLLLAKHFPSVGWVAMRSGWSDDDALLAFRSGPSVGHSHRDQNSFTIAARGEVLLSDPGYQRFDMNYPDGRDRAVTKHQHDFTQGSFGHSVILVDGEGQRNAPGRVVEFFDTPAFAYAAGDATAAYPGLKRFIRHVFHMRHPDYFVVYDEISTDGKPRRVEWLLQTPPGASIRIESPDHVEIVSGRAALSASFPLPGSPAWQPKRDPVVESKFGQTIAAASTGTELRMIMVFEPHAAPPLPHRPMIDRLASMLDGFDHTATSLDDWRAVHITTPQEWEARRQDIRQRVIDIMGKFPTANPPLDARVVSEEDTPRYTRRKVSYLSRDGDRIPAWLLITKGRTGRLPAVLALHETEAIGKDSAVGLGGPPYVHYGHEMAERGFVVLAPDSITAGERVFAGSKPYVTEVWDRAHPDWSALGKMCADHRRGIDYLETLPFVDASRLGVLGHSLGGYNSFFLAAFDERIKACVSSCGFTTIGKASKPLAWSRTGWFVHLPRLAPYLRAGIVPFDMHEVMALVAPRPLFNYSAGRDSIFPDAGAIREAATQIGEVYKLLNAGERFHFSIGDGPHDFPRAVREQAYEWLERYLRQAAPYMIGEVSRE
jgi:dienelactone hydrolase